MNFYTIQHAYYCGIDLHAHCLYVCILNQAGEIVLHKNIKAHPPQVNGKVERSQRSDQEEFYQLLHYVDDQDLNKKLVEWENFYNFSRPDGAFSGRTRHEVLRERLQ